MHEIQLGANEISTGLQSKEISLDGLSYKSAFDVMVIESVQPNEELVSELKPNSTPEMLPERPSWHFDDVNNILSIYDENDKEDRSKVIDEPNSPQISKLLSEPHSLERTFNNGKELKKFQIENNDVEMKKYVNKVWHLWLIIKRNYYNHNL